MSNSDIINRLRYAHENSQQRINGSNIFKEAADEIERLTDKFGRLERALQSCKGEHLVFEDWACRNGYNMDEHPLHYLFVDIKTNYARAGWKAALDYVGKAMGSSRISLSEALSQPFDSSKGIVR